jgi:hypothetical protein
VLGNQPASASTTLTERNIPSEGARIGLGVFLLLIFASLLQFINSVGQIDPFLVVHWVWDYSLGFVKRALPGAAMDLVWGDSAKTYRALSLVSTAVLGALAVTYSAFAAHVVHVTRSQAAAAVAFSGIFIQACLPFFMRDVGRPEQLNEIAFVALCWTVISCRLSASYAAVLIFASTAMLIHEGFLIIHVPLLCAILYLRLISKGSLPRNRAFARVAVCLVGPVCTFVVVWFFGTPRLAKERWIDHWGALSPYASLESENSLSVHYRGILESAKYTLENLWPTAIPLSAAILLCAFYLVYLIWFRYNEKLCDTRTPLYLVGAAAASPIAMFLLGTDYVRWSCLVTSNLIIATLCLLRLELVEIWHAPTFRDTVLGGVALIFLLSPQASGVLGMRRFPEPFGCLYGVPELSFTLPRHPEDCWSNYGSRPAK